MITDCKNMHSMNNIKLTQPEIRLHKNNANGEGIEDEHQYNSNVYRADVLKSREGLLTFRRRNYFLNFSTPCI